MATKTPGVTPLSDTTIALPSCTGAPDLTHPVSSFHLVSAVGQTREANPLCATIRPSLNPPIAQRLTSGSLIPPDLLAKMPPEQRAKFEQSMQARSGKPMTHMSKTCVTQEDLDQNRIIKEEEEEKADGLQCASKVISKSSSKLVIERTCPAPRASTAKMAMEAKTPETIVGSIDMTRAGSGKVHVDIKGRWLGARCAEITDRD